MMIAITRVAGKDADDAVRCQRHGHSCYTVSPLTADIQWNRVRDFATAANRGAFDCLFFSSALPARLLGPLITTWPRVVAIGPQTAAMLAPWCEKVEVLPSFYSKDFVPFLGAWLRGKRVGIPRADVPNPGLMDAILRAGGVPIEVHCYRLKSTGTLLDTARAGAILFTSVGSYRAALWEHRPGLIPMAIGTVTAAAMEEGGIPAVVTGDGSLEGTLDALNRYLGTRLAQEGNTHDRTS